MKQRSAIPLLLSVLLWAIGSAAQQTAMHVAATADKAPSTAATSIPPPSSRPKPATAPEFIIGADDVLAINVWKEPELSSQQVPVRPDGKISLALVGDVQASGLTVQQLQNFLSARLQDYVASPVVTVVVREMRSRTFNILGEVVRPGAYALDKPTTVVDAIALAGGLREWAKTKSIYVLRRASAGETQKLSFNYKSAIRGSRGDFELEPKDTIVVP